jgi:hypothetical protein
MSYTLFKKYGYASLYTLDASIHGGVPSRFGRSGMDIDADGASTAYAPKGSGLAALDVLADGMDGGSWVGGPTRNGKPIIQGANDPSPGYLVSSTSWTEGNPNLQSSYVPANTVPFWVIPGVPKGYIHAAPMGALGIAYRAAAKLYAPFVAADIGPQTHYGEGSIRLAQMLNVPDSAIDGGVNSGIFTILFYENLLDFGDWTNLQAKASALFDQWGGDPKMQEVIQTIYG